MTYQQWLADAAQALNQVNPTENGKVDALVLLQHATGKSRTQILAFDETEIDEKVRLKLTALLDRRLKGEPIAYILGEKEFWSLPLNVSEGTLIPRPDTEILVEKALQIALEKLEENPPHFRILDLGTGTGAIALALASELSPICQKKHIQLDVIGVDLMPEVTAASPSGMAATARLTAMRNVSSTTRPLIVPARSTPTANTITQMPSTSHVRMRLSCDRRSCRGVLFSFVCVSASAMWPICVCMPVSVTTARPRP